jgi:hypothetical protein
MKHRFLLPVIAVILAGCPGHHVTIYRSLSEPGAMQTCDANQSFRAEAKGSDAKDAKAKVEDQISKLVRDKKGCGALIYNEGSGKALDGTTNHVADFQLCRCGS